MKLRSPLSLAALFAGSVLLAGCPDNGGSLPGEATYPLQPETVKAIAEANRDAERALASAKSAAEADAARQKLRESQESGRKAQAAIDAALLRFAGTPEIPTGLAAETSLEGVAQKLRPGSPLSTLAFGRQLYRRHCVHCHGLYGWGDGPTANFLLPKPRDFRPGEVKFTSTKPGAKPTHEDLKRTLAQGIQGSMMPAFGPPEGVPELGLVAGFGGPPSFDLDAVASYVQVLLMRGELERKLVYVFAQNGEVTPDDEQAQAQVVVAGWKDAAAQVLTPEAPRPDRNDNSITASVEKGNVAFHTETAQCVKCHGQLGLGDGLNPNDPDSAKDVWGNALRPANLTLGVYRGGRRPIDLYRRISVGIKGNVMPGFGGQLKPDQIWNLVDYVQALGLRKEEPRD